MEQSRKLIGIEMEIYGFYMAATETLSPAPKFAAFKSISDFPESEEGKTNKWQDYAAYTAAEFCLVFIEQEIDEYLS